MSSYVTLSSLFMVCKGKGTVIGVMVVGNLVSWFSQKKKHLNTLAFESRYANFNDYSFKEYVPKNVQCPKESRYNIFSMC